MPTDLYALVYVSDAVRPLGDEALDEILESSRSHNERVGVTGFLAYERAAGSSDAGTFVQYIEGTRDSVREVFEGRIRPASQHHHIEVKRAGPIEARSFAEWTMAFERRTEGALEGFSDLIHKLGPPPQPGS